jgi:hypothetical protein
MKIRALRWALPAVAFIALTLAGCSSRSGYYSRYGHGPYYGNSNVYGYGPGYGYYGPGPGYYGSTRVYRVRPKHHDRDHDRNDWRRAPNMRFRDRGEHRR